MVIQTRPSIVALTTVNDASM